VAISDADLAALYYAVVGLILIDGALLAIYSFFVWLTTPQIRAAYLLRRMKGAEKCPQCGRPFGPKPRSDDGDPPAPPGWSEDDAPD
jgi:hypothetical protein